MASLRGFCTVTLLLAALIPDATCAGFFKPGKNRPVQSKLADKAAGCPGGSPGYSGSGTPQFPNYIQAIKIDPSRMMGKWYYYMDSFNVPSDRTTVNIVATFTNLLNGSLTLYPGSNTQAIALEQLFGSMDTLAGNQQCNTAKPSSYLYYLTVDGQLRGIGFSDGSADIDGSSVLSTDYETYALIYECSKYNVQSGVCLDPYVYVFTRERPDKISETAANTIASAINQALGPYCFTADMMQKSPWMSDKPECPAQAVTDACYVSLRNAYLYLADPNFNG